eukprot:CAMPEP_0172049854 /NCGR_PEP_ID=MMETSP1043-20130122/2295_1 /TAXON_ID=464988 /ORGANISM="Hemiselmis andersenii, Strain CCMP441" /LENGTH=209 /DNA_ID=CAMNT_0012708865 /DNA_START=12 /DNA_END=638 /DNA_ORIENTATION=+
MDLRVRESPHDAWKGSQRDSEGDGAEEEEQTQEGDQAPKGGCLRVDVECEEGEWHDETLEPEPAEASTCLDGTEWTRQYGESTPLPPDLMLRVWSLLPLFHATLLSATNKACRAIALEPVLHRHIDLTAFSSRITDAAVERLLQRSNALESLVLEPPASPPYLTWRLMQSLACHPCTSTLSTLRVTNCGGLVQNTPKPIRPIIGSDGVR